MHGYTIVHEMLDKARKTGLDPNQTSRPFTVSQYTIITIYDNYIGSDVCEISKLHDRGGQSLKLRA